MAAAGCARPRTGPDPETEPPPPAVQPVAHSDAHTDPGEQDPPPGHMLTDEQMQRLSDRVQRAMKASGLDSDHQGQPPDGEKGDPAP